MNQNNAQTVVTDDDEYDLDTDTFAEFNGVKGPSVRSHLCRFGSYFGIKPIKLRNGRLRWPRKRAIAVG